MPKLDEQTQLARREHILDAAERCFARAGFHRTSMQDICREAGISPGALYLYFASKEALITGLCEREGARLAQNMSGMTDVPDFMAAITALAEHYCFEEPVRKMHLHMQIGAEAVHNPQIAATLRRTSDDLMARFAAMIDRVRAEGRIAPQFDSYTVTRVLAIMGDGLYWHRATDPAFDPREVFPTLMSAIAHLLNPGRETQGPTPDVERKKPA